MGGEGYKNLGWLEKRVFNFQAEYFFKAYTKIKGYFLSMNSLQTTSAQILIIYKSQTLHLNFF